MPGSRSSNNELELCKSPRESGEDSEDESEILEESPCGRWVKRREEVSVFFFHKTVYHVLFKQNIQKKNLLHAWF